MTPIKNIRIIWTENNGTENKDFATLAEINKELRKWARTAPDNGCYDKTKFLVTWADGETWEGRLDLDRSHAKIENILGNHIAEFCRYSLGLVPGGRLTENADHVGVFLKTLNEREIGAV